MATADSKYSITFGFRLEEEGKNEKPMFEVPALTYNGLNYAGVVMIQEKLVEALSLLTNAGKQQAEALQPATPKK